MSSFLYWIHLKEHNDIFSQGYVGVTKNIVNRFWRHKTLSRTSPHVADAIQKHGWDSLVKEILVISNNKYCLLLEEKIRPVKNIGWNIALGGGKLEPRQKGYKMPKATCDKISTARKGMKFTEQHKINLSKAKIGKPGHTANNFKGFTKATNIVTGETILLDGKKAMEKLGLHDSAVYRCLNGKQSSHKGYFFERLPA